MGAVKEEYLNNIPSDEELEEYYQYYIATNSHQWHKDDKYETVQ